MIKLGNGMHKTEDLNNKIMETELPKYVICPEGCKRYLTPGKKYKTKNIKNGSFETRDDEGDLLYCKLKGCAHLNGEDWIIPKDNSICINGWIAKDNNGKSYLHLTKPKKKMGEWISLSGIIPMPRSKDCDKPKRVKITIYHH